MVSIKQIAFKCLECNEINTFPICKQDGHKCKVCNGHLVPIGYVGEVVAKGTDRKVTPRSKKSGF